MEYPVVDDGIAREWGDESQLGFGLGVGLKVPRQHRAFFLGNPKQREI
jgi:hypothetical protein